MNHRTITFNILKFQQLKPKINRSKVKAKLFVPSPIISTGCCLNDVIKFSLSRSSHIVNNTYAILARQSTEHTHQYHDYYRTQL